MGQTGESNDLAAVRSGCMHGSDKDRELNTLQHLLVFFVLNMCASKAWSQVRTGQSEEQHCQTLSSVDISGCGEAL